MPRKKKIPDLDQMSALIEIKEVKSVYVTKVEYKNLDPVRYPGDVADFIKNHFELDTDPQENLVAAFLDSKNRIIRVARIFRGTFNSCTVATRDVLYAALKVGAAAVIIAHNHPSGDPEPSTEDVLFTRKLKQAGEVLSLDVLDHLVIGGSGKFVSLKERGAL